jgi:hypothetical protein
MLVESYKYVKGVSDKYLKTNVCKFWWDSHKEVSTSFIFFSFTALMTGDMAV